MVPSLSLLLFQLIPVLALSCRSMKPATLLNTSILKLLQLCLNGNALHYQNGCKAKTTTTGGLKTVELRAIFLRETDRHPIGKDWREAYEKGLPFRDFSSPVPPFRCTMVTGEGAARMGGKLFRNGLSRVT
jgi:hypothetical protein